MLKRLECCDWVDSQQVSFTTNDQRYTCIASLSGLPKLPRVHNQKWYKGECMSN